ncbi:MAG: hypothetical protein AAB819_00065 [Patescibacteria group bacterium]
MKTNDANNDDERRRGDTEPSTANVMMLEPLRVIRLYSWIGAARIRVIRFSFAYWCRVRKRPEVRLRGIIIKYGAKKEK